MQNRADSTRGIKRNDPSPSVARGVVPVGETPGRRKPTADQRWRPVESCFCFDCDGARSAACSWAREGAELLRADFVAASVAFVGDDPLFSNPRQRYAMLLRGDIEIEIVSKPEQFFLPGVRR